MSQQPYYGPGQQFPPQQPQQYGPPPGQPYPQQPYGGYQQPMPMMPPFEPRNGLGLAALICAIIGVLCAVAPILFIVGGPLSIIAISLGIAGMGRVRRGVANNSRTANIATALGILALLVALNGARVTFTAVNEFGNRVEQISDENQQFMDCLKKAQTMDETMACSK